MEGRKACRVFRERGEVLRQIMRPVELCLGVERFSLNRPESSSTNPTCHLWRDKLTALSGPLSGSKTLACKMAHAKVKIWP